MSNIMNTPLRIAKFGGSSVADFDSMNRSADIVLINKSVRIVVLSASLGVTNLLVALANGNKNRQVRSYNIDKIRNIQYSIIDHLTKKDNIKEKIDSLLENISILSKSSDRSHALTDELISHGELMSTLLFVEVLRQRGVNEVEWFDIRKIMRTNDNFGCAEPDSNIIKIKTRYFLEPKLIDAIIITQGFIGSEAKGRTTTLGRGGSDYTASLLGEALQVARIDIWTDVPGIYTTDPSLVPDAKIIDEMSFSEASEMAHFGAKILHPETLLPAIRSKIPVFVGSSKEPNVGGTIVYNSKYIKLPLLRALALRKSQILLTLHNLNIFQSSVVFLSKIFKIIACYMMSVDLITISKSSITLTMDRISINTSSQDIITQSLITELSSICRVEIEENLALIALIGNKLSQAFGINKKVFNILDPFNIKIICYGASKNNLCLIVQEDYSEIILKTLHSNLFI